MDLNIVTCWWGGWPKGTDRGPEYISRLRHDVDRYIDRPHSFTVLTDDPDKVPEGIETKPLKPFSWLGILPKIGALNPENGFRGRVVVFDLDNVIVGDLDPFADYDGSFCVRKCFHADAPDGDLLAFDTQCAAEIWERLSKSPVAMEHMTGGRERYAYRLVTNPDTWDEDYVASYKMEVRREGLRPDVRVVCFHGNPRPHEVSEPWMEPWGNVSI